MSPGILAAALVSVLAAGCVAPTVEVLGDSISAYSAEAIVAGLEPTSSRVVATPSMATEDMAPQAGTATVAVIELGANDVWRGQPAAEAIQEISAVAAGYLQRGSKCVVFVTLPTATGLPGLDAGFRELNVWFRARPYVADYGHHLDADVGYTTDGLHPTEAGQRLLASLIREQVDRCLES